MKLHNIKLTDQIAGHENAGPVNAGHEIAGYEFARHDSILFNFSFFLYCDADVAAMELCNVIMK